MTKIINTTLLLIILSLIGVVATPLVNAEAQNTIQANTYQVVTASKGLNLRDENCNYIKTLPFGSIVTTEAFVTETGKTVGYTNCTVKDTPYTMIEVSVAATGVQNPEVTGFVATDWVESLKVIGSSSAYPIFEVGVDAGLNVRNQDCQKINTISYKSSVNSGPGGIFNEVNCEVGGQMYAMSPFFFPTLDTTGYIATAFLATDVANNTNTTVEYFVADETFNVATLEKYDLAVRYNKNTTAYSNSVVGQISYIYPAGGGGLPGISIQYQDLSNTQGYSAFNFAYYCLNDTKKDSQWSDKNLISQEDYLARARERGQLVKEQITDPFFTEPSSDYISETYSQYEPLGYAGGANYYFIFKTGQLCTMELRHVNGSDTDALIAFMKKNVSLHSLTSGAVNPNTAFDISPSHSPVGR